MAVEEQISAFEHAVDLFETSLNVETATYGWPQLFRMEFGMGHYHTLDRQALVLVQVLNYVLGHQNEFNSYRLFLKYSQKFNSIKCSSIYILVWNLVLNNQSDAEIIFASLMYKYYDMVLVVEEEHNFDDFLPRAAFENLRADFAISDKESFSQTALSLAHTFSITARASLRIPAVMHGNRTIQHQMNLVHHSVGIRTVMANSATEIQDATKIFMMSPSSVAQFCIPGNVKFDLLVIDEASQVPLAEALGSILRSKQVIVVGDDKQLPPTKFFDPTIQVEQFELDENGDQIEGNGLAEIESILGLAQQKLPTKTLLWHYRSKHENLIAFSNKRYYNNRLYFVPPPSVVNGATGLELIKSEGVYEGYNEGEAELVAEYVIKHAIEHPKKSLMVGCFSAKQQQVLENAIAEARKTDSSEQVEQFFATEGLEPFAVKNLENLQGDERDVVFISVGFAQAEDGILRFNFGPLNKTGGERRLNVLITRAKYQLKVFSAITATDFGRYQGAAQGVLDLAEFLGYAAKPDEDLPVANAGAIPESTFEYAVKAAIEKKLGYTVVCQVGQSNFRIDLAIPNPKKPTEFLFGIECDGEKYHAAASVRERDRLRQDILELKGWTIYRIWGSDWRRNRERCLAEIQVLYNAQLAKSEASGVTVVE